MEPAAPVAASGDLNGDGITYYAPAPGAGSSIFRARRPCGVLVGCEPPAGSGRSHKSGGLHHVKVRDWAARLAVIEYVFDNCKTLRLGRPVARHSGQGAG
jgi:hypothetical protein